MGYELHITRAEYWCENEGLWISEAEWAAVVEADPELRFSEENGPLFAEWKTGEGWLDWREGNIETKYPDDALINKMCEIASRLDANVQGDDGERYPLEEGKARRTEPPNLALFSILLTAVALVSSTVLLWLDRGHAPGAPRPMSDALLLVVPLMVFGFSWFVGAGVAVVSWFTGKRNRRLSLVATAASAAVALLFFSLA